MSNVRVVVSSVVVAVVLLAGSSVAYASPEVWARSYSLETAGNSAGALEALESLPENERSTYLFALRRAWLLYQVGRYDAAVTAYRQAATLAPESLEAPLGSCCRSSRSGAGRRLRRARAPCWCGTPTTTSRGAASRSRSSDSGASRSRSRRIARSAAATRATSR